MQTAQSPIESLRPKSAAREVFDCGMTAFYELAKRPDFPKARRLSPRLVVYDRAELLAWRDAHVYDGTHPERDRLADIGRAGRARQIQRRRAGISEVATA